MFRSNSRLAGLQVRSKHCENASLEFLFSKTKKHRLKLQIQKYTLVSTTNLAFLNSWITLSLSGSAVFAFILFIAAGFPDPPVTGVAVGVAVGAGVGVWRGVREGCGVR